VWSRVRWPEREEGEDRDAQAERIETEELARYECEACGELWDNAAKNNAVRQGEWVSEVPGASNRRVGFHLNSIYSPWVGMSKLAGEHLRAIGDPARRMDFSNSRLAEPFEEEASSVKTDAITAKKAHAGQPMVLPDWARLLLATADVQKDHIWYVIRAWGHGYRSQLVRYGIAPDFDALGRLAFDPVYATYNGEAVACSHLMIDARYRTDEVYRFAQRDPARVWPVMGDGNVSAVPIKTTQIKEYGVQRRTVNPNYWQDVLHGFITGDDTTQWLPHAEVGDDYVRQLCSMHKIHDPKAGTWLWQVTSKGADNHLRDAEVYQCVLAQETGVATLPSPEQEQKAVAAQRQQTAARQSSGGGWLNSHRRHR